MTAICRRFADHKVFDGDEVLVRYSERDWKRRLKTVGLKTAIARSTIPPSDRRTFAAQSQS